MQKNSRKSYTIGYKRYALAHLALTGNKQRTSANLKCPRTTLVGWCKIAETIKDPAQLSGNRKIRSTKNRALFPSIEKEVYDWFLEQRRQCFNVDAKGFRLKMMSLLSESKTEENCELVDKFVASRGFYKLKFHSQ